MQSEGRGRLLQLLTGFSTGMLVAPDTIGGVRSWPVMLAKYDGIARVWLFARGDAGLASNLEQHPRVCLTMHGLHASVSIIGTAEQVHDRGRVFALWNDELEHGLLGSDRGEPILLRIDPIRADVWTKTRGATVRHAVSAVRHAMTRRELGARGPRAEEVEL